MQLRLNMSEKWSWFEIATFGLLIENYLVIPYQNVEAAWNISVEREPKNLECYVTPISKDEKPDIVVIHIGFNDTDF